MKKLILALPLMLFLTACPQKEEVAEMTKTMAQQKAQAVEVIQAQNFSVEGLLKAQEYFFGFSEKVHLMVVDQDGKKGIQALIKKTGVAEFCKAYLVSMATWDRLDTFCKKGAFYKCSPEMKSYAEILKKFKELSGEHQSKFDIEVACQ